MFSLYRFVIAEIVTWTNSRGTSRSWLAVRRRCCTEAPLKEPVRFRCDQCQLADFTVRLTTNFGNERRINETDESPANHHRPIGTRPMSKV